MRTYGKIESGFWQNKKIRPLSDAAKLLLLYIYTCPHGNSVGCFVLPTGYISEDMGWPFERVSEHVTELVSKRFLNVDNETKLIHIIGWFDHNSIENINVAKAAIKTICLLPDCAILKLFFKELNEYDNKFINEFTNTLRNTFPNTWSNPEPKQQPEPEPKPEPKPDLEPEPAVSGYAQEKIAVPKISGSKKDFKNDFDLAAACCCAVINRKSLSPVDQSLLMGWCKTYDFERVVKPILIEKAQAFEDKNLGKRPASLSYFAAAIKEKAS